MSDTPDRPEAPDELEPDPDPTDVPGDGSPGSFVTEGDDNELDPGEDVGEDE